MANEPEIAVAIRTFGNSKMHEGVRVKAGTKFAVGKPQGGLPLLTYARFRQLVQGKLVRPLTPEDAAAAPAAKDPTKPRSRAVHEEVGAQIEANREAEQAEAKPKRPTQSARAASRRRTQDPEPPAPVPLNSKAKAAVPTGSPNGTEPQPSSSPEAPPSNSSTSRPRGRRRAQA